MNTPSTIPELQRHLDKEADEALLKAVNEYFTLGNQYFKPILEQPIDVQTATGGIVKVYPSTMLDVLRDTILTKLQPEWRKKHTEWFFLRVSNS